SNARAISAPRGTSAGQASASARMISKSTGRLASERELPRPRTARRQASTIRSSEAKSASTSSSVTGFTDAPRISRAAGHDSALRRAEVAPGQHHLRLGGLTARALERLARAKPPRCAAEQLARPFVLAELGHGDAAQRERRRIVAQRDALQRSERITGRQRTGGGGDEGVHAPGG